MSFESAREQMEQSLSTPTANSDRSPDVSQNESSSQSQQPSVTDLEKLEKFMFQGREWTAKDLQQSVMLQADYTRKTQEIAGERKYFDNLESDLKAVRENPALEADFKKLYPEKFHGYLEYVRLNQSQQPTQQPQTVQQPQVPKEFLERFEKLESTWQEQEVEKAQAHLDNIFEKFSKKYEMADEASVIAAAQMLHAQKTKLDEAKWEQLFKNDHERHKTRYEAKYKSTQKSQQEASRASRDSGPGGATPGQAPQKMNLKQAIKAATEEASRG